MRMAAVRIGMNRITVSDPVASAMPPNSAPTVKPTFERRPVVSAGANPGLAGEGRQPVRGPADLTQLRGDLPGDDHADERPEAVHEQPAQERHRLQRVPDAPAGPRPNPVRQPPERDGDHELRRHADGEAKAGLGHGKPDDLDRVDSLAGNERAGAEREDSALNRGRPHQRVVGQHAVKEAAEAPGIGSHGICPLLSVPV